MVNVKVPRLGESIFEVEVLRWLKKPGDAVKMDEPLCELGTDKTNFMLPSPASGVLAKVSCDAGGKIAVGADIASIDDA
jgi:2-oxoglutarate dehydrogenase E2 component (dihydrolipoamide succinyltransferase)